MAEDEKIGTLEEEAIKRKERLKNLKRKNEEATKAKFRSYKPIDENLKDQEVENIKILDLEEAVQDQLKAAKTKAVVDEIDISTLAPRKPDWDLKRDIEKKLEKLKRRTQKQIVEIVREKYRKDKNHCDLATAVDSVTID